VKIVFADRAWEDYLHWRDTDANIHARLNDLINDARRSPFRGLGKPEPLRGDLGGWWSRRITTEHRLVYRVSGRPPDQALEIAQCRFHY
jgi:toxin YoeB